MPKEYLVANLRVDDTEIFKEFLTVALPLIEKYGGKLLARGPLAYRHEDTLSEVVILIDLIVKLPLKNFISVTNIRLPRQLGTKELIQIL